MFVAIDFHQLHPSSFYISQLYPIVDCLKEDPSLSLYLVDGTHATHVFMMGGFFLGVFQGWKQKVDRTVYVGPIIGLCA